jgi:D-glucosaminate-6-phosphate ammonia-lyase
VRWAGAADRALTAVWRLQMAELQLGAGEAIAQLIGAPMAMVTSGCAGAMMLASAAALAGGDAAKIIQLPDTSGLPNELLIPSNQRYHYDRCWEMAGAKLVEYEPTEQALEAAITHRACGCVARPSYLYPGSLALPTIAKVAHAHGIPVLVDAADQTYPLDRMTKYIEEGADVQCMAAKYIGASQSTGLAIGTREFVSKMFAQNFIGFEMAHPQGGFGTGIGEHRLGLEASDDSWYVRAVGRPSKIDRQEIVGVWAAVKEWTAGIDHAERIADFRRRSSVIAEGLKGVPGVRSVGVSDKTEGHDPHPLTVELDPAILPVTELIRQLKHPAPMSGGGGPPTALYVRRPMSAPRGRHLVRMATARGNRRMSFHPIAAQTPPYSLAGGVREAMGWNGIRRLPLATARHNPARSSAHAPRLAGWLALPNAVSRHAVTRTARGGAAQLAISMFGLLPGEEHIVVALIARAMQEADRMRAAASTTEASVEEVAEATARL